MGAQLTRNERQLAVVILLALTIVGLILAGAGKDDPIGIHGLLIMACAIAGIFAVIPGFFEPEPSPDRLDSYYDEPSKIGILLAMAWAAVGMFVGDWVAWLMPASRSHLRRRLVELRPIASGPYLRRIFGFGGNAMIATASTSRSASADAPPDQARPMLVLAAQPVRLPPPPATEGITQGKEYAELEWGRRPLSGHRLGDRPIHR